MQSLYDNENGMNEDVNASAENTDNTDNIENIDNTGNAAGETHDESSFDDVTAAEDGVIPDENMISDENTADDNEAGIVPSEKAADVSVTGIGSAVSYGGFKNKWNYEEYERSKSSKKAYKNYKGLKSFAVIMTVVAVLSVSMLIAVLAGGFDGIGSEGGQNDKPPVISIPTEQNDKPELSKKDIIKKAKPSVVSVVCEIRQSGVLVGKSVGSGFIITDDGYIVTNNHVVSGASSITVIMIDGTEYEAALKGGDELTDIAVLKVNAKDLPAIEIGNSDYLEEGDTVIVIGNPGGIEFAGTSTHGMVSAVNREIKLTDNAGNLQKTMTVIQVDAAINKGNSGGPVVNGQGQVIGVATLRLGTYEAMGFALPINGVIPIVQELIVYGKVKDNQGGGFVTGKAVLGVTVESVNEDDAKTYGVPLGAYVRYVNQDSGADKAGIKNGDIITKFEGKTITTKEELIQYVNSKKPGDTVKVTIYRNGEMIDVSVVLGAA